VARQPARLYYIKQCWLYDHCSYTSTALVLAPQWRGLTHTARCGTSVGHCVQIGLLTFRPDRPRWDPFVNARRAAGNLPKIVNLRSRAHTAHRAAADLSKFNDKKARRGRLNAPANGAPCARPPRRCAATRGARALCDASWQPLHLHREEARLGAAARAYRLGAVQDCCLVRAQLLDERVAPGGDVGVEVLEGERVGPQARAHAQVDVPR
jgi:hypothetical protein